MLTRARDHIQRLWVSRLTCSASRDAAKSLVLFLDGVFLRIADQF